MASEDPEENDAPDSSGVGQVAADEAESQADAGSEDCKSEVGFNDVSWPRKLCS